jgi:peptidoglycan/xylan/chitin deacetylase (PgdA/CDA1 family)
MSHPRRWRPTLFIRGSIALHGLVAMAWVLRPALWEWAVLALILNHLLIAGAGLWPRSRLLGPNLQRLPAQAVARREVAITIDDGPDPVVTPQVLAILAEHGAHASFFCIGVRAAQNPEVVRAIVAAGHRIENHGQRHRNHSSLFGPGAWSREVCEAQETLTELAGRAPVYFRAVAGLRNPFLEPVLCRSGLHLASWSRRGYDTRASDVQSVFARLTRSLSAGDVLLMHDGHAAQSAEGIPMIVAVLPRILAHLASLGLVAVALPPAPAESKD